MFSVYKYSELNTWLINWLQLEETNRKNYNLGKLTSNMMQRRHLLFYFQFRNLVGNCFGHFFYDSMLMQHEIGGIVEFIAIELCNVIHCLGEENLFSSVYSNKCAVYKGMVYVKEVTLKYFFRLNGVPVHAFLSSSWVGLGG